MTTIIIIVVVGALILTIMFLRAGRDREDEQTWLIHDAYSSIFTLLGHLKKDNPEGYKKVGKKLDDALNIIIEVEQILQEPEEQNEPENTQ